MYVLSGGFLLIIAKQFERIDGREDDKGLRVRGLPARSTLKAPYDPAPWYFIPWTHSGEQS